MRDNIIQCGVVFYQMPCEGNAYKKVSNWATSRFFPEMASETYGFGDDAPLWTRSLEQAQRRRYDNQTSRMYGVYPNGTSIRVVA